MDMYKRIHPSIHPSIYPCMHGSYLIHADLQPSSEPYLAHPRVPLDDLPCSEAQRPLRQRALTTTPRKGERGLETDWAGRASVWELQ